jgi:predicted phage terminase large subunit-like protein
VRRLIINVPPRHMKSLSVSVAWPAWTWAQDPARDDLEHGGPRVRWLTTSYAQALAIRDNMKMRRLITSPPYRRLWADRFELSSDQNTKMRIENDRGGHRVIGSVDSAVIGEGGDVITIDDPSDVKKSESSAHLESTLSWFDEVIPTRLNDPQRGAIVIIMQRLGTKDLTGHALAADLGYVHLCLPAEYEPDHPHRFRYDPRDRAGEPLWPQRFPTPALADLKRQMSSYAVAGQLQQRPSPRGGGLLKPTWFRIAELVPRGMRWVRYWDLAATAEGQGRDPDYTAGALVGVAANGDAVIADLQRLRAGPADVERAIEQCAALDGKEVPIYIEQEPGSSGKAVLEAYQRRLFGWAVYADRKTQDTVTLSVPFRAAAENGFVALMRGPWVRDFLAEAADFPTGAHDDMVVAAVGGYNRAAELAKGGAWTVS